VPANQALHGIGAHLRFLANHGQAGIPELNDNMRRRYVATVANRRNGWLHNAGNNPRSLQEVRQFLAEVEGCIVAVLAL
jgi:hypothetical protein